MHDFDIQHDQTRHQFIIQIGDDVGFLEYSQHNNQMDILHTIVAPTLEGRGIGAALARHALNYARTKDQKVAVYCQFVASWLKRHSEYADLTVENGE